MNKVKERREELGLTQEELERKSGVSRQTISALENKDDLNTSTKVMLALANALEITIDKLFFA